MIQGIYDLHVHSAPDIKPRKTTDYELAERFSHAGYKGFVIKCHHGDTSARAKLMEMLVPKIRVIGGITLNRYAGGLNPYAVEACAKLGGKYVWFPTLDSYSYQMVRNPKKAESEKNTLIKVLDGKGRIVPAGKRVLQCIAENDLIVGTGHISAEEGLVVAKEAQKAGVKHVVITHADNSGDRYTLEEQKECVSYGAFIEYSYFTVDRKMTPIQDIITGIKEIGAPHIILSTDLGQPDSVYPDIGMNIFIEKLLHYGITEEELQLMLVINPEKLLGEG